MLSSGHGRGCGSVPILGAAAVKVTAQHQESQASCAVWGFAVECGILTRPSLEDSECHF